MRAAFLALFLLSAPADAACRLALSMGLDVSGSVDGAEYRLQVDGLAAALTRPEVQEALFAMPGAPVRIQVFEWAGSGDRREILPWTEIATPEALAETAARLRATARVAMDPATALGEAMLVGAAALRAQPECWRRTLDVSGDGQSNAGPRPRDIRRDPRLGDITINALVVGAGLAGEPSRRPDTAIAALPEYFRIEVIRGPDAFVETADGYADFEEAMVRKLLRELKVLAVTGPADAPRLPDVSFLQTAAGGTDRQ